MELTEFIISMLLAAFAFVLGWLVGVERNNRLCKDLSHWKAYVKELELKQQVCYKSNKPCEHNCGGLCKDSY